MTVLEELRNRAAEIEDEVGRLENERLRFVERMDKEIRDLRTLLRLARGDETDSKGKRVQRSYTQNPTPLPQRIAEQILVWDQDKDGPITAAAMTDRLGGYKDPSRPRQAMKAMAENGLLVRGDSIPALNGKGVPLHTYEVADREQLERAAHPDRHANHR